MGEIKQYKYKKGIIITGKKKEYCHAFSFKEMPIYVGGLSVQTESNDNLDELIELAKKDNCKYLSIYNINQKDFEKIIKKLKTTLIDLNYCNLYPQETTLDLKCLKQVKKLKKVKIEYLNQKVRLWNMRFNHKLEEVIINDCKEILNQKGLEKASVNRLTIRRYAYAHHDTNELLIKDFNIFNTMPNLEYLNLFIKKKKNKKDDLIALSKLRKIKEIRLPKNYFFFSQFAWLSSKLENVIGIGCYQVEYDHANEMDGYIINGSRMCCYVKGFEKAKFKRYNNKFAKLVEQYKNDEVPPLK